MGQHLLTFLFILCFWDFIFYLLKYIIMTTQTRSAYIHTSKKCSIMLQNRITLFGLINNLSRKSVLGENAILWNKNVFKIAFLCIIIVFSPTITDGNPVFNVTLLWVIYSDNVWKKSRHIQMELKHSLKSVSWSCPGSWSLC